MFVSSFKDKTIKLWKITERDKRPEGYNLKDEEGKLKDLSTVTSLQVSCCLCPKFGCFYVKKVVVGANSVKDLNMYLTLRICEIILIAVLADCLESVTFSSHKYFMIVTNMTVFRELMSVLFFLIKFPYGAL